MTWLLKLYPQRWRRRYGEEFATLIASQRFSFLTVVDIIAGAIDAWTQPQAHLAAGAAAQPEGDTIMLAKCMRLRSAGHGVTPTTADGLKGASIILVGTALSVVTAGWMQRRSVDPVYTETLMSSGWLIASVVSMPYTALKGWPVRTQAIFISVLLLAVVSLVFGGVRLNAG